ncbi:GNAT family N-acetyltransferase [Alteromonas sp. A081]|uniref:GNAT family N-acetyltransferase n=1 Tax=Alteromonas sp. A081 TaxID=3410269 RepID=UPI003B985FBD
MAFTVKSVSWENGKPIIQALRKSVFVVEWRIPQTSEFDEQDSTATHVLVVDDNNEAVATARLTRGGELGRIAVKRSHRTLSIYKILFAALLKTAEQQAFPTLNVVCNLDSVDYHRSLGFKPAGRVFMDAGVPRQRLKCKAKQFPLPDVTQLH